MHFFAYHVLLCVLVGLTETIRFARSADSPPPTLPQPYRYRAPAKQEVGHLLSPSQYGGSRTSLSSITIANKVPFFKDDAAIPGHEQVRFVYFNILPSTKRVILQVMTQSTGSPIVGLCGTAIPRRYHSYLLPNFGQVIDRASFNVAMELFGRMLGFGGGLEEQYGSAEFGCYAWYAVEYAKLFSTETSRVYYIEATVEPSSELRVTYYSNEDTPGLTTFFRLYQPTDEEYKYRELVSDHIWTCISDWDRYITMAHLRRASTGSFKRREISLLGKRKKSLESHLTKDSITNMRKQLESGGVDMRREIRPE